jgi:hypothetical protein
VFSFALQPDTPMWDYGDYAAFVDYDIQLVKPALLFADHVSLRTFRATMQEMIYSIGMSLHTMPMRRLFFLMHVVARADPRELKVLGLRPEELPSVEEVEVTLQAAPKDLNGFWKKYESLVERTADAARVVWAQRFRDLEDGKLGRAAEAGLLTIEGWLPALPRDFSAVAAADIDEMYEESMDQFVEQLNNAERQPLLDAGAAWVANNWPHPRNDHSRRRHRKPKDWHAATLVSANAIIRLPGLDRLPLIEVLDLRDDLREYLPSFRSEMVRLGEDIANDENITAVDIAAEVDRRWHKEIAPVLADIRQKIASAAYPRQLLSAVTSEKDALGAIGGALVLAAGSVAAGASMLVPAAAAATYPFAKALNQRISTLEEVRKNRMFFLYALEKGIREKVG